MNLSLPSMPRYARHTIIPSSQLQFLANKRGGLVWVDLESVLALQLVLQLSALRPLWLWIDLGSI